MLKEILEKRKVEIKQIGNKIALFKNNEVIGLSDYDDQKIYIISKWKKPEYKKYILKFLKQECGLDVEDELDVGNYMFLGIILSVSEDFLKEKIYS